MECLVRSLFSGDAFVVVAFIPFVIVVVGYDLQKTHETERTILPTEIEIETRERARPFHGPGQPLGVKSNVRMNDY